MTWVIRTSPNFVVIYNVGKHYADEVDHAILY